MLPFLPRSLQAQAISNLFILTLWIALGVFLLVTGLVIIALIRFRSRPGEEEPRQNFGNRPLEIGWTLAPALLLLFLFVLTVRTSIASDPSVPSDTPPDLVIIGHQWWWEVRYPTSGVVTANEVHLPVGKKIVARFESADVIHDFWVPQLGRKIDLVPGHPNNLVLEVDQAGNYTGTCAEFCGAQHAWMRILVIAQTPAEFDAWILAQSQVPPTPTSGEATMGANFFAKKTCNSCHTIAGTNATGTVGPNLTHIASRETLGAGVLNNNPGSLTAWLANPQNIKPGILMPNFGLTNDEVTALVAYLETLK